MLRRLTLLLCLSMAVIVTVPVASAGSSATSTPSTTESTATTDRELPGTTLEAADDGDDDAAAPWLIGSGIAAAVAIAVGGYLLKRRAG